MCFRYNDFQDPNNGTKFYSCKPFSCLNKNSFSQESEIIKCDDSENNLDFYDQYFWDGMPLYMGKLPGSAKMKNNVTFENIFDSKQKGLKKLKNDCGVLKNVQIEDNKCIKKGVKNSEDLFNPHVPHINNLFLDFSNIRKKCNNNLIVQADARQTHTNFLNGQLKTIPENEPLHYFYTSFQREDLHI